MTRATVIAADPLDGERRRRGVAGDQAARRRSAPRSRSSTARCTRAGSPRRTRTRSRSRCATRSSRASATARASRSPTAAGPRRASCRPSAPRIAREAALRPQERFAALLAGRDAALACELLALRARLDLDQGRDREAALQLEAALGAGLAELEGWRELDGMPERLEELAGLVPTACAAAAPPRGRGTLDEAVALAVERALGRLEAALRARTARASF